MNINKDLLDRPSDIKECKSLTKAINICFHGQGEPFIVSSSYHGMDFIVQYPSDRQPTPDFINIRGCVCKDKKNNLSLIWKTHAGKITEHTQHLRLERFPHATHGKDAIRSENYGYVTLSTADVEEIRKILSFKLAIKLLTT